MTPNRSFLLPLLLLSMIVSIPDAASSSTTGAGLNRPSCASLGWIPDHQPWLSLPGSRLVLNPNPGITTPLPPRDAPGLPVNLGYYAGRDPVPLLRFFEWQAGDGAAEEDSPGEPGSGAPVDLLAGGLEGWVSGGSKAGIDASGARVTVVDGPVTAFDREATVDFDRTPFLRIAVPDTGVEWAVKVNGMDGGGDLIVQWNTRATGDFAYDLRAITGWKGRRAFRLRLFAVGDAGRWVTFAAVRFVRGRAAAAFLPTKTEWFPDRVDAAATAGGMGLALESTVFFPDESTVAQRIRIAGGAPAELLVLVGRLPRGRITHDAKRRLVRFDGERLRAIVSVSRRARWLGVHASEGDWLEGRRLSESEAAMIGAASGDAVPTGGARVWALAFDGVKAGDEIVVSARFEPVDGVASRRNHLTAPAASPRRFDSSLERRRAAWDRRLERVPRPLDFDLRRVDPLGVTPDAIRRAYYRAWAFTLSNLLPPMPENGYPFPQYSAGKASMWAEGHERAAPSAQWESMIAIQLAAWADPESAWRAFEGMMTLVDDAGTMGGEGLPSRHAQAAWILHCVTGDRKRLAGVYPAVKRLLLWKAADPRWIYKGSTPPGMKDSEFVVQALLDMGFAVRIARALDRPDEVRSWEERSRALAADYARWFWETPGGIPYRVYVESTGRRSDPGGTWTLEGLALPPELLSPEQRDSLLDTLRKRRQAIPFLFPGLTKHATYMLAVRGMWRYGRPEEALEMVEAAMRDVERAGEFAETYVQSDPPRPDGVRPSMFGAAMMIDATLWRNGVILGEGPPLPARLPGARGAGPFRAAGETIGIRHETDAGERRETESG